MDIILVIGIFFINVWQLGKQGYPMTIVVDKEGKIVQIENGTSPEQRKKLKQTIQSLCQ